MSLNVGKIIKARGPVVDVQFAADKDLSRSKYSHQN